MSQAGFPINIFDYFELNDSGSVTVTRLYD